MCLIDGSWPPFGGLEHWQDFENENRFNSLSLASHYLILIFRMTILVYFLCTSCSRMVDTTAHEQAALFAVRCTPDFKNTNGMEKNMMT